MRPPHSLAEEDNQEKAIEAWAESEPRAAIAFVRRELRGDRQAQALSAVLAIWGKHDPDAAWRWVAAEMPTATHHFDTLLEVFGRTSTATAARYAAEFASEHPSAAVEAHLAALLGVTYRGDFAGARALVDANQALSAEDRGTLTNFIAGQWARFAPAEAAAWALQLPAGVQRDQALNGLTESWSDVDPARAAEFAVGLPGGEVRTVALRQAISKWVMADADAARAWVVKTDRHEDFDQAVGAIASDANLVNRDPLRALRWAATIFDDDLRVQKVSTILFAWYPLDPAAATHFLEAAADFTPQQRQDLLSRLRLSRNAP